MKINVLGRYGRFAPKGGATNSYLLTANGKRIVIDMGAGSLANLQKYIDIESIDAVIITHLHFDHMSDLGTLGYACGYKGIKGLKVYMPSMPIAVCDVMAGGFDVSYINDGMTVDFGGINIEFCSVPHPVETYALRIVVEEDGRQCKLCYTSDISREDSMKKVTDGMDIVIGDSAILSSEWSEGAPHLSVKQLAMAVPESCKLYLAHLTAGQEEFALDEAIEYHINSALVTDFEIK